MIMISNLTYSRKLLGIVGICYSSYNICNNISCQNSYQVFRVNSLNDIQTNHINNPYNIFELKSSNLNYLTEISGSNFYSEIRYWNKKIYLPTFGYHYLRIHVYAQFNNPMILNGYQSILDYISRSIFNYNSNQNYNLNANLPYITSKTCNLIECHSQYIWIKQEDLITSKLKLNNEERSLISLYNYENYLIKRSSFVDIDMDESIYLYINESNQIEVISDNINNILNYNHPIRIYQILLILSILLL